MHSVIADDNFLLVAAHIDEALRLRIEAGDYIDFSRLIPRDRLFQEDDNRMEMINKDGHMYWVPGKEIIKAFLIFRGGNKHLGCTQTSSPMHILVEQQSSFNTIISLVPQQLHILGTMFTHTIAILGYTCLETLIGLGQLYYSKPGQCT